MARPPHIGVRILLDLGLERAAAEHPGMRVPRRLGGQGGAFLLHWRAQTVDRAAPLSYLTRVPPLDIITLPDRKLRLVSDPIERVDADLLRFADQMLETMYAAPGIGLAAIQVGVPRRIIVLDVAQREDETADGRNG